MITIRELRNRIITWPNDTMNFRIVDVFAWRGYYAEPACYINSDEATKEHNLTMLDALTSDTFIGWKGGEYQYDASDQLHFETDYGAYTDGRFIMNFLMDHGNDPIVRHLFFNSDDTER